MSVVNVWAIGDSLEIGVATVLDSTALETGVDTGDLRLGAEEVLVDTLRDVHDAGAKGCRPWHHDLVLWDINLDAGEFTKGLVVLLEPWHLGSLVRPGEDLDLEGVALPPSNRQGLGCVDESWDLWVVHEDTVVDGGDQVDDLLAVLWDKGLWACSGVLDNKGWVLEFDGLHFLLSLLVDTGDNFLELGLIADNDLGEALFWNGVVLVTTLDSDQIPETGGSLEETSHPLDGVCPTSLDDKAGVTGHEAGELKAEPLALGVGPLAGVLVPHVHATGAGSEELAPVFRIEVEHGAALEEWWAVHLSGTNETDFLINGNKELEWTVLVLLLGFEEGEHSGDGNAVIGTECGDTGCEFAVLDLNWNLSTFFELSNSDDVDVALDDKRRDGLLALGGRDGEEHVTDLVLSEGGAKSLGPADDGFTGLGEIARWPVNLGQSKEPLEECALGFWQLVQKLNFLWAKKCGSFHSKVK